MASLQGEAATRRNTDARYVLLAREAIQATCAMRPRNQGLPCRVLPERRLPALSWLPGRSRAHIARCRAEGNCAMLAPISAMSAHAAMRSMPGMVSSRDHLLGKLHGVALDYPLVHCDLGFRPAPLVPAAAGAENDDGLDALPSSANLRAADFDRSLPRASPASTCASASPLQMCTGVSAA